jgi:hypothetical protein
LAVIVTRQMPAISGWAHATISIDVQYHEKYGRPRPVRKIAADKRYLIDVDADINSADAIEFNKG